MTTRAEMLKYSKWCGLCIHNSITWLFPTIEIKDPFHSHFSMLTLMRTSTKLALQTLWKTGIYRRDGFGGEDPSSQQLCRVFVCKKLDPFRYKCWVYPDVLISLILQKETEARKLSNLHKYENEKECSTFSPRRYSVRPWYNVYCSFIAIGIITPICYPPWFSRGHAHKPQTPMVVIIRIIHMQSEFERNLQE